MWVGGRQGPPEARPGGVYQRPLQVTRQSGPHHPPHPVRPWATPACRAACVCWGAEPRLEPHPQGLPGKCVQV